MSLSSFSAPVATEVVAVEAVAVVPAEEVVAAEPVKETYVFLHFVLLST